MAEADDVRAREDVKARLAGRIAPDGTRWGSDQGNRAMVAVPKLRRKCNCGCGCTATHVGLGDGLALMSGCELSVRRWVRDGRSADA